MEDAYNQYFFGILVGEKAAPRLTRGGLRFILSIMPVGDKWRSDAVYFLAWSLYVMILEPLRSVQGFKSIQSVRHFKDWQLIQEDIGIIVNKAEKVSGERDRDYVSATSVAIALGAVAEHLRTTSLQIWGPRD